MEIERRFLVEQLPEQLDTVPHKRFEQGYLSTAPVLRVRREGDEYVFTYKGQGGLAREEVNLPLNPEAYAHLIQKADGLIIQKTRYFLTQESGLLIEMDLFEGDLYPLKIAEVEFSSVEEAHSYQPEDWFGEEITGDHRFSNSAMSREGLPEDYLQKR